MTNIDPAILEYELSLVLFALSLILFLCAYSSAITVTGNLHGRDNLLGWLAWTTFWATLVSSALEIEYPAFITIVFGGLVANFSKTVLGVKKKK